MNQKSIANLNQTTIFPPSSSLAQVWLAAHYDKKLTKSQTISTSLFPSIQEITMSEEISLRVSSQLLLGISVIYNKKARYLLNDLGVVVQNVKGMGNNNNSNLNLQIAEASVGVVGDVLTEFDILLKKRVFNLEEAVALEEPLSQTASSQNTQIIEKDIASEMAASEKEIEQEFINQNDDVGGGEWDLDLGSLEVARDGGVMDMDLDFGNGFDESLEVAREAPARESFGFDQESMRGLDKESMMGLDQDSIKGFEQENIKGVEQESLKGMEDLVDFSFEQGPGQDSIIKQSPVKHAVKRKRKTGAIIDQNVELGSSVIKGWLKDASDLCLTKIDFIGQEKFDPSELFRGKWRGDIAERLNEATKRIKGNVPDDRENKPGMDNEQVDQLEIHQRDQNYDQMDTSIDQIYDKNDYSIPNIDLNMPSEINAVDIAPAVECDAFTNDFGANNYDERFKDDGKSVLASQFDEKSIIGSHITSAPDGYTKSAQSTLKLIADQGECKFTELVGSKGRTAAARLFFEVLVLKTRGAVEVQQEDAFGEIEIKAV